MNNLQVFNFNFSKPYKLLYSFKKSKFPTPEDASAAITFAVTAAAATAAAAGMAPCAEPVRYVNASGGVTQRPT